MTLCEFVPEQSLQFRLSYADSLGRTFAIQHTPGPFFIAALWKPRIQFDVYPLGRNVL